MLEMHKVIVVGAGMAGLSAAKELERLGSKVLILEGSQEIGGRVGTDHLDGYVLDRGFQVLPSSYKHTNSIVKQLGLKLTNFDSTASIWSGSKFYSIANPIFHPTKLLKLLEQRIFKVSDFFKLVRLLLKRDSDFKVCSIDELRKIGFSKKSLKLFFYPFFSGIFLEQRLETPLNFLVLDRKSVV